MILTIILKLNYFFDIFVLRLKLEFFDYLDLKI